MHRQHINYIQSLSLHIAFDLLPLLTSPPILLLLRSEGGSSRRRAPSFVLRTAVPLPAYRPLHGVSGNRVPGYTGGTIFPLRRAQPLTPPLSDPATPEPQSAARPVPRSGSSPNSSSATCVHPSRVLKCALPLLMTTLSF